MKDFLIPVFLLVMLSSCTADDIDSVENIVEKTEAVAKESINLQAIKKYIEHKHGFGTRSSAYSLVPYINGNDTVMFIANYGASEGWEIFSNSTSTPMVLFKSNTGIFEILKESGNESVNELIENCATNISLQKHKTSELMDDADVNPEWRQYMSKLSEKPSAGAVIDKTADQSYVILLVSSTPVVTRDSVQPWGGRLKTKWAQGSYYNLCTPYYNSSSHSMVGCVAVAFGQFMYHSHYYIDKPQGTVTQATYDSTNNIYNFSGYSTSVWEKFNTTPDRRYDRTFMMPTAVYLGYIGKSIKTAYGIGTNGGSGADIRNTISQSFLSQQTSLSISVQNLSATNVRNTLAKGHPVILQTMLQGEEVGHAYMIDHLERETEEYYNFYLPFNPKDGPFKGVLPSKDKDWTLSELQAIYGKEVYADSQRIVTEWYKMNWGWGGSDNDIFVNAADEVWQTSNGDFSKSTAIMYKID